jgi:hypothetical protein
LPGLLVLALTEAAGDDLHGLVADEALCGVSAALERLYQLILLLSACGFVASRTPALRILAVASQSAVFPVTTFLAVIILSFDIQRTMRVGGTRTIAT